MNKFVQKLAYFVAALTLLIGIFTTGSGIAHASTKVTPHSVNCSEGWVYDHLTRYSDVHNQVGGTISNYNGTSSPASVVLTSSATGTVSLTVSASASVNAGVIVSGVSATFGVSVTASIAVTTSHSITISVPAYKYGNGAYGVWNVHTYGHYYYRFTDCSVGSDYGYIHAYVPRAQGWNTWIS